MFVVIDLKFTDMRYVFLSLFSFRKWKFSKGETSRSYQERLHASLTLILGDMSEIY